MLTPGTRSTNYTHKPLLCQSKGNRVENAGTKIEGSSKVHRKKKIHLWLHFSDWLSRMVLNLLIHDTILCFQAGKESGVMVPAWTSQQQLTVKFASQVVFNIAIMKIKLHKVTINSIISEIHHSLIILLCFTIIYMVKVNYIYKYNRNTTQWSVPVHPFLTSSLLVSHWQCEISQSESICIVEISNCYR